MTKEDEYDELRQEIRAQRIAQGLPPVPQLTHEQIVTLRSLVIAPPRDTTPEG